MRLIPCPNCRQPAEVGKGEPLLISGFSSPAYVFRCTRCRKTSRITRAAFLSLPALPPLEVAKLLPDFVLAHYMG